MTTVGFLHTAGEHETTFAALVAELDAAASVVTVVDAALLADARVGGPDDPQLRADVRRRLTELADAGCQRVVCTCSTIGAVAEDAGRDLGLAVSRVDRPMAEAAVAIGGRIVVLATVESTIGPTSALLVAVASAAGVDVDLRAELVAGAWEHFEAGELPSYHRSIADEIERAAGRCDVVVLAQASMAPAADLAVGVDVPVLTSSRLAVEQLLA